MTSILPPTNWYCPNCRLEHRAPATAPMTPYHPCPRLGGIQSPLVPAGVKARVVRHDREDYVAAELVQTDADGRPLFALTVDRPDGSNDTVVFAPTVRVGAAANQ